MPSDAVFIDVLEASRYANELTGVGSMALVLQAEVADRDVRVIDVRTLMKPASSLDSS
jgi:hypothetical protein